MAMLLRGRNGYLVYEDDDGTFRVDRGTTDAHVSHKEGLTFEVAVEFLRPEYKMQNWKDVIGKLGDYPQRQDATLDQLEDLVWVANKIGFYDAADAIKTLVSKAHKNDF